MSRSIRSGVSLAEVIVVVGILGIAVGLLLPATRRVGEAANRTRCANNLRQLMLALHNYESTHDPASLSPTGYQDSPGGLLPPGCMGPGINPEDRLSWLAAMLPYVEQDPLYRRLNLEAGYAQNRPAVETRIGGFLCPSSKEGAPPAGPVTHYVAMAGIGRDAAGQPAGAEGNGFMGYDRRTSLATIKDGTSNTIALMETDINLGSWARGGASTVRGFDPAGPPFPFGRHPGAMLVAMADGSVRPVAYSIDPKTLAAAITIAGGEPNDPSFDR